MNLLLIPYLANIVILVPAGLGTLFNLFTVSGGHFPESPGWRTLVGSLWTALLIGSVLGLFRPVTFSPLLLFQVIYKSIWLLVYVTPRFIRINRSHEIHGGFAVVFTLIVLTYPLVIPWEYLFGTFLE